MAVHDYVISNGTGAAVRSDLNSALAAIVSQNSNASEPATMYAYQWWADTTTGLLKIRNAANSAWVTIGTLASANLGLLPLAGGTMTGVLAVTAGTAALPGIAVSGDPNTGIYSPGADQIGIATGGTGRVFVSSAGLVGIGTTGPNTTLSVVGGISGGVVTETSAIALPSVATNGYLRLVGAYQQGSGRGGTIQLGGRSFSDSGNVGAFLISANSTGNNNTTDLTISTQTSFNNVISDIVTVTATGRVGIGTTSPSSNLHVSAASGTAIKISETNNGVSGSLQAGSTSVSLGTDTNHSLNFYTNAVERARIDTSGRLLVGTSTAISTINYAGGDRTPRLQVVGDDVSNGSFAIIRTQTSPSLFFGGGTSGTNVASGNAIGSIVFTGYHTDKYYTGASIDVAVDGTPGANDMPGRLVFSTTPDGPGNSPTERMRITNAGIIVAKTNSDDINIGGTLGPCIASTSRCGFAFSTNSLLPTNGAGTLSDNGISLGLGSYRWSVVYAGTGTINTSDANLKQDIDSLSVAELTVATNIKSLIKKFRFKDAVEAKGDDARIHVGVIAQEVAEAFVNAGLDPYCYGLFCEDELEDGSKRLGIRYDELLAFVIASL